MTAANEVFHHARAERPRPVERDGRDEVCEALRREVLHERRHAARLHLEHGARLALAEHLRCLLIYERYAVDIECLAAVLLDVLDGIRDDRERAQAEEVHLEQAELLDMILVVLRDERTVRHGDRHVVRERMTRDHDARRVRRGMARQPLDLAREIHEAVDILVLLVGLAEVRRRLECLV